MVEIIFKVTVLTSEVTKITFGVALITFKVAGINSSVAKITFEVAEVKFKVAVITYSVARICCGLDIFFSGCRGGSKGVVLGFKPSPLEKRL